MSKKVLVISTSLRKNSNSNMLAQHFAKGAKCAGNDVELVSLEGKNIAFCRGCLACQSSKKCVIGDDADVISQKMCDADVLVFATPIYYYEMSGQMKTMLDRANPLFVCDYKFRDVYFLASAAEEGEHPFERAKAGLEGWIECFEKARLAGTVFAGGFISAGEVDGDGVLKKAYDMGANV